MKSDTVLNVKENNWVQSRFLSTARYGFIFTLMMNASLKYFEVKFVLWSNYVIKTFISFDYQKINCTDVALDINDVDS